MKLASWNVNGIRACTKDGMTGGLHDFLTREQPDVVALQEVKAADSITCGMALPGYQAFWHGAEKAGYSGTGLLVRDGTPWIDVTRGMSVPEYDREGRVMVLELADMLLVNMYAPHSQRELARLDFKLAFSAAMDTYMDTLRQRTGKPLVVTGDLNVAHHDIDLANPKANRNNAGFLPQERAWLDGWQNSGMIDAFRHFCPEPGHYTWWSQRVGVREKNIGWRIDAFWVDKILEKRLAACSHRPTQRGSDHCPVVLELT